MLDPDGVCIGLLCGCLVGCWFTLSRMGICYRLHIVFFGCVCLRRPLAAGTAHTGEVVHCQAVAKAQEVVDDQRIEILGASAQLQQAQNIVQEQQAHIYETSELVKAMQDVADSVCDIVIKLSGDLQAYDLEHAHNQFFGFNM